MRPLRSPTGIEAARDLRDEMTDAEKLLWYHIRSRRLVGIKFRRQVPLGPYVVDFTCPDAGLVIELDGGQHAERVKRDAQRTAWLEREGFRVIRFWNTDVLQNLGSVLERIVEECRR